MFDYLGLGVLSSESPECGIAFEDAMTEVQVVKTVDDSKHANIEKIILTQ